MSVFEDMVLRKISEPKRDEKTKEWRRLLKEERNDLYSSSNIIWEVKSGRMRWAGHVLETGEVHTCVRWVFLLETEHLEDLA